MEPTDEDRLSEKKFCETLLDVDLSYSVSAEDIDVKESEDLCVRGWWWRKWFEQPAEDRLWNERHEDYRLTMELIASDYLKRPFLHSPDASGAIASRLLAPAIKVLQRRFVEQTMGPHRWFAGLPAPWNVLAVWSVSAFWLGFWSLCVLTSYLFLPTGVTVGMLTLALAMLWRRWKTETEWKKHRATKVALAIDLSVLAEELGNRTFNSGEMIRRLRALTPEFQPPSIVFSLLELEYPEKASPIVFDGRNQGHLSMNKQSVAEAVDFLLNSLKSHMGDHHHQTDPEKLERCEKILREAISGLRTERKGFRD